MFHGFLSAARLSRQGEQVRGRRILGGGDAGDPAPQLRVGAAGAEERFANRREYLTYPSPQGSGTMKGYFARPAGSGKWPGVVVIHENRGLNPYIEDVARRLAVDGFVAFAPDALTPLGGYPGNEEKARQMFGTLDARSAPRT
jgi:carboxymethylenebutenolidase